MNSSSKVIVVATLIMVVSLVMVLTLVLVLLAELYCSLLLNRRRNRHHNSLTLPTTTTTVTTTATTTNEPSPSNITSSPKPLKTHLSNFHNEQSSPIVNTPNTTSTNDFIYISNPVYSNEATSKSTTPFETPESSPSRLETGEEEEDSTPTLSPMKDLPQKACSVSLKDVRLLETSSTESNSNVNNDEAASSSSSASPYTSSSW